MELEFPCRRIVGGWIDAENKEVDRCVPDALAEMAERKSYAFSPGVSLRID
jgi:hypothetical protein